MNIPEVVVFDLGKVLVDFDYSKAARLMAARSNLDVAAVHKFINQSPLHIQFETGLVAPEQFFAEVRTQTGFRGELEDFVPIFSDIFEPITPMIGLHASLRQKRIPTYIFSNTNHIQLNYIRNKYPFFGGFDGYILSYEHGAMKPQAKLYEVVERETGRRGGQIFYIDDRAENIEAGSARGWQVILHETPEKTLAAFKQTRLLD